MTVLAIVIELIPVLEAVLNIVHCNIWINIIMSYFLKIPNKAQIYWHLKMYIYKEKRCAGEKYNETINVLLA